MVVLSYNKEVVLCEHFDGAINGEKMEHIVQEASKLISPREKHVLMDGCSRKNSRGARHAYTTADAIIMKISARSPDLKLIENFFHLAKKAIKRQFITETITQETFKESSARFE